MALLGDISGFLQRSDFTSKTNVEIGTGATTANGPASLARKDENAQAQCCLDSPHLSGNRIFHIRHDSEFKRNLQADVRVRKVQLVATGVDRWVLFVGD